MRRLTLKLAAVLALALLAAACGGGGGTAEAPTDATGTDATGTEATATDAPAGTNTGNGTLTVGTLLPETGSLAFLGPPEIAGARLAVQDINDAGGVLGEEVELIEGDSGDTSTDIANQTVDRLLSQNADVVVGAASSAVSFTVIDKIIGAGVIHFSPANTSKEFTTYDDRDLYFRTAPSDILQGQVLGEIVVEDGNATTVIMALQDPYGEGLAEDTAQAIEDSGGQVLNTIIYDPQAQNYDAEVQQVVADDPDAVVVIGFDESARILSSMIEQGVGPADKMVYGADGNMGNALGEQFEGEPGALEGMKGTTPLTELTEDFQNRLTEVIPDLVDFNYSGETYDAVTIVALAAEVAGTDEPIEVAAEINGVTKDGEKCDSFAACKEIIDAGEDIDYDGITGPLEFVDAGEPGQASYGILEFNADNEIEVVDYRFAGQ